MGGAVFYERGAPAKQARPGWSPLALCPPRSHTLGYIGDVIKKRGGSNVLFTPPTPNSQAGPPGVGKSSFIEAAGTLKRSTRPARFFLVWLKKCRGRCLVANLATLPQKWPPPPRNVADSCELFFDPPTLKLSSRSARGGQVVIHRGGGQGAHQPRTQVIPPIHPIPCTLNPNSNLNPAP